jgi:hypothetical protein
MDSPRSVVHGGVVQRVADQSVSCFELGNPEAPRFHQRGEGSGVRFAERGIARRAAPELDLTVTKVPNAFAVTALTSDLGARTRSSIGPRQNPCR